INATPVLTGAANRLQLPGIDVLGGPFGWQKGAGDWTGVSAAIARQDPVQVIQEAGTTLWQQHLPPEHSFQFGDAEQIAVPPKARVWISPQLRLFDSNTTIPEVQWHPQVLWVGIGCERGTSRQLIESAIQQVCQAHHLAEAAIAGVATLDLKADEVGLVELCRDRHWPLRCFAAEQLKSVPVPTPSEVVAAEVGTPSVAEAAALVGAGWTPAQADAISYERANKFSELQVNLEQ
ncbi:MAG TPA: cobalamin biosynthesis protein, partial [Candidatus Obscuribacterales bacterium]